MAVIGCQSSRLNEGENNVFRRDRVADLNLGRVGPSQHIYGQNMGTSAQTPICGTGVKKKLDKRGVVQYRNFLSSFDMLSKILRV